MSNKLYEVTTRAPHNSTGTDYSRFLVVAENPADAYQMVLDHMAQRDVGSWRDREMLSVTLLAEEKEYPSCGTLLLTGEDILFREEDPA